MVFIQNFYAEGLKKGLSFEICYDSYLVGMNVWNTTTSVELMLDIFYIILSLHFLDLYIFTNKSQNLLVKSEPPLEVAPLTSARGLPRRDCRAPSSVEAMSLSLSSPRPLSIHD